MPEELDDIIRENAAGPKSAEVDGQRVEQHSLSDLIKADEHFARKRAMRSRRSGLKFTKLQHSGAQ